MTSDARAPFGFSVARLSFEVSHRCEGDRGERIVDLGAAEAEVPPSTVPSGSFVWTLESEP